MLMFAAFASTYKALYWAILISTALFGITILQAWTYMTTNSDRMYLRTLVAIIVALDFCITAFIGHLGYYAFVENFGNADKILILEISAPLFDLTSMAVTFLIQAFFASRVAILQKGKVAPILILLFALGSAVAGTLEGIHEIIDPSTLSFSTYTMRTYSGMFIGFAVLSDFITTFYLTKTFYDMKSTSDINRTDQILNRLINFVVRRGILVTTAQMASLTVFLVQPDKLYWTPVYFCTVRIYVITMIAMLNNREDMKRNNHSFVQPPVSRLQFKEFSSEPTLNGSTVTKPSSVHFQISSSSRNSNVSSVMQDNLEKLAWNNN